MSTSNQLYQILAEIATQLPSTLTILGGIVWAIVRWKRHPRVSLTILIGLASLLLHLVAFVIVFATIRGLVSYGYYSTVQTYQTIVSIMYNIILAIATGVLIAAIFMQRKKPPMAPPAPDYLAEARAA